MPYVYHVPLILRKMCCRKKGHIFTSCRNQGKYIKLKDFRAVHISHISNTHTGRERGTPFFVPNGFYIFFFFSSYFRLIKCESTRVGVMEVECE